MKDKAVFLTKEAFDNYAREAIIEVVESNADKISSPTFTMLVMLLGIDFTHILTNKLFEGEE